MIKAVGQRLKKAREQSGLTQNQVAKILVHLRPNIYAKWKNNKNPKHPQKIKQPPLPNAG